jgi:hypothetical protein
VGGLIALLAALFEDDIRAVYIRRGLTSYGSAFEAAAIYLPHDTIIPDATVAGDLPAVLSALPSVSVHFEEPIDGANRPADEEEMKTLRGRVESLGANVAMTSSHDLSQSAGQWLTKQLAAVGR